MAIRAVILDIGGVLETNPSTGWQDRWAARVGIGAAELERRLEPTFQQGSVGAIGLERVHQRIADELGLDPNAVDELMEDVWVEYVGQLNRRVADWFATLRPRHRTGLLSNSFVGGREREQRAYGLQDLCDAIVYSHEEGMLKPDLRIYAIACERLGTAPAEAVFVDDLPVNVEGARAAGMKAVEFRSAEQMIASVEALL